MKIGIDISQIQYKHTGVARFTEGLINAIREFGSEHTWLLYYHSHGGKFRNPYDPTPFPSHMTLKKRSIPEKLEHILMYRRGLHSSVTAKLIYPGSSQLDWFISSDWIEPPLSCKKSTIVHDLVFKRYPNTVDPYILATQQKRFDFLSKESSLIFVDSISTKNDLHEFYPSLAKKCVVNYPGVDQTLYDDDTNFLTTIQDKEPYILAVGKHEPRKNVQKLIDAWLPLKNTVDLVIVGQGGWGEKVSEQSSHLRILKEASDQQLATLYRHAKGCIFPSLYEGFGYPLVEAMKYSCPVACSNTSSLAEIGAGCALLFDPTNVKEMSNAIMELINQDEHTVRRVAQGIGKAKEFSWSRYYNTLISTLSQNL